MAEEKQTETKTEQSPLRYRALVLGGTGEVGRQLVRELVESENVVQVTAINRRLVGNDIFPESEKLKQVVLPISDLKNEEYKQHFEGHDVAFCALGTTRKDAGSPENFVKVDYQYVADFADVSKAAGVKDFHVVSSIGANKNSWFLYPRTKGQMEDYVSKVGFRRTFIYRPPLLGRSNPRFVEKIGSFFMKAMPVSQVARSMRIVAERSLANPDNAGPATQIFEPKDMWNM